MGSLTAIVAAAYDVLSLIRPLLAEHDGQPPESLKLPPWLIAISSGVMALFLAACLSRRVRAWLRMRPRLSRPSPRGDIYLQAFTLHIVLASLGTAVASPGASWAELHEESGLAGPGVKVPSRHGVVSRAPAARIRCYSLLQLAQPTRGLWKNRGRRCELS